MFRGLREFRNPDHEEIHAGVIGHDDDYHCVVIYTDTDACFYILSHRTPLILTV
jgi:hypothetical protein